MAAPVNSTSELNVVRKKLSAALGDNMKLYLSNLGEFFKCKISKEEFDLCARKLMSNDQVRLHNEFLLTIFTKCQALTSTMVSKDAFFRTLSQSCDSRWQGSSALKPQTPSRSDSASLPPPAKTLAVRGNDDKPKLTSQVSESKGVGKIRKKVVPKASFENRFQPVNVLRQAPTVQQPSDSHALDFCSRDALLPDVALIQGRLYVSAWDSGLECVEDDCVQLVMAAVQDVLKNVISVAVGRRKGYRLRENRFPHSYGAPEPTKYMQAPLPPAHHDVAAEVFSENWQSTTGGWPSIESAALTSSLSARQAIAASHLVELGQGDAAVAVGAGGHLTAPHTPMTCRELFVALQMFRNTICSHTIYAVNLERIGSRLWHPSADELAGEQLYANTGSSSGDKAITR